MTDKPIYLISNQMQEKEVKKYCYGECGEILIGAIEIDGYTFFPCVGENCPFEDKTSELECNIDFNGLQYNKAYIRKLIEEEK